MLAMVMPWARGRVLFGGLGWGDGAEGEEDAAGEEKAADDEIHLDCSGRQAWTACLPTGLLSPTPDGSGFGEGLFERRACGVNSSAPSAVMSKSSSRRTPNSPRM